MRWCQRVRRSRWASELFIDLEPVVSEKSSFERERVNGRAVLLQMRKSLLSLGNRRKMPGGNPPQRQVHPDSAKPLPSSTHDVGMSTAVDEPG